MEIKNRSIINSLEVVFNKLFDTSESVELDQSSISKVNNLNLEVSNSSDKINPIDFTEIAYFSELERLSINGAFIVKDDLICLSQLKKLRELIFSNCSFEEMDPVEINTVKILSIDSCEIADYTFIEGFRNIENLYINNSRVRLGQDGKFTKELQGLKVLDISFSDITKYEFLAELPNLDSLAIEGLQVIRIIPFLPQSLSKLYVSANDYENTKSKINNVQIFPGRFVNLFIPEEDTLEGERIK
jgi:hypothetical protein